MAIAPHLLQSAAMALPDTETLADQAGSDTGRSGWATAAEWESYRPLITRLYADENKTLNEVSNILEHEYNFRATKRMYKARINKWGLDKKNKAVEVIAIAREKSRRDKLGLASQFLVRGRILDYTVIEKYLHRHPKLAAELRAELANIGGGANNTGLLRSRLPSDIRVCTPSPPPVLPLDASLRRAEDLLFSSREYTEDYYFLYEDAPSSPRNPGGSFGSAVGGHMTALVRDWFLIIVSASQLLAIGYKSEAFQMLNIGFSMIEHIIKRDTLGFLMVMLNVTGPAYAQQTSRVPQQVRNMIREYSTNICASVLGDTHPLTRILHMLAEDIKDSDDPSATPHQEELLLRSLGDLFEERAGPTHFAICAFHELRLLFAERAEGADVEHRLRYLTETLEERRILGDKSGQETIMMEYATALMDHGRREEGMRVLEAGSLGGPIKDTRYQAFYLYHMANYYRAINRRDRALTLMTEAVKRSEDSSGRVSMPALSKMIALEVLLKEMGNDAAAIKVREDRQARIRAASELSKVDNIFGV